jgi:hypothetical protein
MKSKIKKHFIKSRFYENYNNINNIILNFKKIKKQYDLSKNTFKQKKIQIISNFDKCQIKNLILEKYISLLVEKYGIDFFKNEFDKLKQIKKESFYYVKIKRSLLEGNNNFSCRIILEKKINVGHDIKRYIIYSHCLILELIKSTKIGNIKNVSTIVKMKPDIIRSCDVFLHACNRGHIELVKFLVKKRIDINKDFDYALYLARINDHNDVIDYLIKRY